MILHSRSNPAELDENATEDYSTKRPLITFFLLSDRSDEDGFKMNIDVLYVCPNYRGQKIGYELARHSAEYCNSIGDDYIRIYTASSDASRIVERLIREFPEIGSRLEIFGSSTEFSCNVFQTCSQEIGAYPLPLS